MANETDQKKDTVMQDVTLPKVKDDELTSAEKKKYRENLEKVKKVLSTVDDLVKQNNIQEAKDLLLVTEKQVRQSGDGDNTTKIIVKLTQLCGNAKQWKELNEILVLLSKKRSQIKQAITHMVQEAMKFIDQTPDKDTKIELINTLRQITEGKIYVEIERSRVVRILAEIREKEGNIEEAAKLMQEVQIETIGSMEPREKIDFILDQMRLCLDKNDFVRGFIISKKITKRSLNDEKHQDLKVRFYKLMIRYYVHRSQYLEIANCYYHIYDTNEIKKNRKEWVEALKNVVIFTILSQYDNEQSDLMNRIFIDKKLDEKEMKFYKEILESFVNTEIIYWNEFESAYSNELLNQEAFKGNKRWDDLKKRAIEKNIRIISAHYSRIRTQRLSSLLSLDVEETENFISKMVTSKTIHARIDRLDGVILFKKKRPYEDVLNDWSSDVNKLLNIVEKTVHLINREQMVHGKSKGKGKSN